MERTAEALTIGGTLTTLPFLPPEFLNYGVSILGTMVGAFAITASSKLRGTLKFTWAEFFLALSLGLIVAPWVIAYTPMANTNDPLWHHFAASGLGTITAPFWISLLTKRGSNKE